MPVARLGRQQFDKVGWLDPWLACQRVISEDCGAEDGDFLFPGETGFLHGLLWQPRQVPLSSRNKLFEGRC